MTTTAKNTIETILNNRRITLKASLKDPASMHSTQDRKAWEQELRDVENTLTELNIPLWDLSGFGF